MLVKKDLVRWLHQKPVYIHVNLVYQLKKNLIKGKTKYIYIYIYIYDIHRRNVEEYILQGKINTKSAEQILFKEFINALN